MAYKYTNGMIEDAADCIYDRHAGMDGAPEREDIAAAIEHADEQTVWDMFVGPMIDSLGDWLVEYHGLKLPE